MKYIVRLDVGSQLAFYLTETLAWSSDPFKAAEFSDRKQARAGIAQAYNAVCAALYAGDTVGIYSRASY